MVRRKSPQISRELILFHEAFLLVLYRKLSAR